MKTQIEKFLVKVTKTSGISVANKYNNQEGYDRIQSMFHKVLNTLLNREVAYAQPDSSLSLVLEVFAEEDQNLKLEKNSLIVSLRHA